VRGERRGGASQQSLDIPLSLYIHIPWCLQKCPYCDFNSYAIAPDDIPEKAYITALCQDIRFAFPLIADREIHTVFIGGGTPSLLSPAAVGELLSFLAGQLRLSQDIEVSIELNPGTFSADKIRAYKESGINRLSIGAQSFKAEHLALLGRIHSAVQTRQSIETALCYLDNVNLDMMYALPGQTKEDMESDLHCALSYAPAHLSFYQFTVEPDTFFSRHPPVLPDEDTVADMSAQVESTLASAGYTRYEVSAYAKSGRACRHNLNYWRFGDYLGVGAGAHSKITRNRVIRQARCANPSAYLSCMRTHNPLEKEWEPSDEDIIFEFMLNALRLTDGFSLSLFSAHTGFPVSVIHNSLVRAEKKELLVREGESVRPTKKGLLFLTDLQQLFLPDE
jgi:oxygen-independent coproporphyrinogen-3 oxidase